MCICVYECENINAVHQAQTKYAVRKLLQRETYTAGAEFFSSPWMILVFLCIHFFNFYCEGWRCWRCVCVCVVCCVLCSDYRRWQKLPLSARGTYIHSACLSLLMRHHQLHYNFVGVVFSFVFCVFLFLYAPLLSAVLARLPRNTLHTPLHYGTAVVILECCRLSESLQCLPCAWNDTPIFFCRSVKNWIKNAWQF